MMKFNDIYTEGREMKRFNLGILLGLLFALLLASSAAAESGGVISDPMAIGVGARSLGMGRAYVGMAEDSDAIFMNPAGIARITNPKLSSMYTSLMNDVDYTLVGGAYPYGEKSAIGAGIVNSSMGNVTLTNTSGEATGIGNWHNSVVFLSYGTYLSALHPAFYNLDRDVLVGGSLKYFSVGGEGSSSINSAAGNGYSLDLGLLYPATDYMMLGANYQNAVAGKITKNSGVAEEIPKNLKLGAKLNLVGKEGQSYNPHNSRKLYANIDYDLGGFYGRPNVSHYGLEFWPSNNLALRAGTDDNELTAGLGVRFSGVEFNYAYHPYAGINENTTHFFSFAYLGEATKRELRVVLTSPNDKMVIHEDFVKVAGRVEVVAGDEDSEPAGTVVVRVNGINIPVSDDYTFSAEIPVDTIGKKMLRVEARDSAGDYDLAEIRLLRLIEFADVPDGYWALQPIENTGTVGLVEGYPDGSFRPDGTLSRAELATLLVRAKGLKIPDRAARKVFNDVASDHWAAKYIEVAELEGLVKGYPDKSFRPNNKITKAEGITILVRFDNLKTVAEVYEKPFWDVSSNNWSAKYIQAAKEAGLLKFVERNKLRPQESLARAEAVEMLSRTTLANGQIQDLYSWEKGFQREFTPERPKTRASIERRTPLIVATADYAAR